MNLQRCREIFKALWQFLVKYHEPREDDQYWQNLISEAEGLEERFVDNQFAYKICVILIGEIEKEFKKRG